MDITSISAQARALHQSTTRENPLAAIRKQTAADTEESAPRLKKPAASLSKPSGEYNFSVYV